MVSTDQAITGLWIRRSLVSVYGLDIESNQERFSLILT